MTNKIKGIIVFALMVTAGCSSKSAVTPDGGSAGSGSASLPSSSSSSSSLPLLPSSPSGYGFDQWQTGPLGDVFFDYDSATLSAEAQEQLHQNGVWMGSDARKGALIEGHCDERGSDAYNMALGDKRAKEAMKYLVSLSVDKKRIKTVSYGKNRPIDPGHNEEAWAKNRRNNFVVTVE
jgi:peptidoglycan-associated lipoprotein